MQDFSSVNIKNMIIHNVGNKVKGESLEISTEICDASNIYIWYIRNKIIRYIVYIMKNPAR